MLVAIDARFGVPGSPRQMSASDCDWLVKRIDSSPFENYMEEGSPAQRPAFFVDVGSKLTVLHLLAGSPNYTQIGQIAPSILNLCLETYSDLDLVNFRHPILGTALYHASTTGNKAVVERLLQHGADQTHFAGPDVDETVQTLLRPGDSWTPLWAAVLRLDEELRRGSVLPAEESSGAWLKSNLIQNLEKIVTLLSLDNTDMLAQEAVERLLRKKESLQDRFSKSRVERANTKRGKEIREEYPVDLGTLSGEPGEEIEGCIQQACTGIADD